MTEAAEMFNFQGNKEEVSELRVSEKQSRQKGREEHEKQEGWRG